MGLDESAYDYLSRSGRSSMAAVRDLLEDWFLEVPDSHADGIRARIRSGDDEQFESAHWELYVATLLTRRGYELTWEPELPGTTKRPDFLASRSGDTFYVEARAIGSKKKALADRRRTTRAYETVRSWDLPNFSLGLTLEAVGSADLRVSDFKKVVRPWLDGLDPDAVMAARAGSNFFEVPHTTVTVSDWTITVHALPREPRQRKSGQETLGTYSASVGGRLDNHERLYVALHEKAKRYGEDLPHPLVLAVLANTEFATSLEQVASALWGRWFFADDSTIHLDDLQLPNRPAFKGLWRTRAGRRYSHVPAVLVGRFIYPWNLADDLPTLWTASHATSTARLDLGVATWTEAGDQINYRQAEHTALDALGLASDWMPAD